MAKQIKHTILILAVVLIDVAARIFKYNPELDKIFLTSDGQGFKDYEKAVSHSEYLGNKEIKTFRRSDLKADSKVKELHPVAPENPEGDKEPEDNPEPPVEPESSKDYRENLIVEYTELYGKSPAFNIKTETLEARIAEAKEKAQAENADAPKEEE